MNTSIRLATITDTLGAVFATITALESSSGNLSPFGVVLLDFWPAPDMYPGSQARAPGEF